MPPSCPRCLTPAGEYIDDTEDLINIQLDYSRNKLIRFDILITTGTFAAAFFNMVRGGTRRPGPGVQALALRRICHGTGARRCFASSGLYWNFSMTSACVPACC